MNEAISLVLYVLEQRLASFNAIPGSNGLGVSMGSSYCSDLIGYTAVT